MFRDYLNEIKTKAKAVHGGVPGCEDKDYVNKLIGKEMTPYVDNINAKIEKLIKGKKDIEMLGSSVWNKEGKDWFDLIVLGLTKTSCGDDNILRSDGPPHFMFYPTDLRDKDIMNLHNKMMPYLHKQGGVYFSDKDLEDDYPSDEFVRLTSISDLETYIQKLKKDINTSMDNIFFPTMKTILDKYK